MPVGVIAINSISTSATIPSEELLANFASISVMDPDLIRVSVKLSGHTY